MNKIKIFVFLVLCIPFMELLANNIIKIQVEIKLKETLIEESENNFIDKYMFLRGKREAFFEVLEMIEEAENATEKEGS